MDKIYKTVFTRGEFLELFDSIEATNIVAVDTETTGIDVHTDSIIGASFSTKIGNGYYIPTQVYDSESDSLKECYIDSIPSKDILKLILEKIKKDKKKVVMHNASFDTSIINNQYGIDLLPELWMDTMLAVHTVQEEGAFSFGTPFGLKSIAQMYQQELGLNIEDEANKEQIELKDSIHKNGGSTTKNKYQIYKADLDILSKYAAADTDLTLRVANLFYGKLHEEKLDKFFFEDEVMPVYKEVTIPMERRGIQLDIELLHKTNDEMLNVINEKKNEVISELKIIKGVKDWIFEQSYVNNFPPKNRGVFAKMLVKNANLNLSLDAKGEVRLLKKEIEKLEDSPYKRFLIDHNSDHGVPVSELSKISLLLWIDSNNGDLINIQSKKHLSEIAFNYLGLKPISKTDSGTSQFNDIFIESISSKYTWATKLRVYNKLVKM